MLVQPMINKEGRMAKRGKKRHDFNVAQRGETPDEGLRRFFTMQRAARRAAQGPMPLPRVLDITSKRPYNRKRAERDWRNEN